MKRISDYGKTVENATMGEEIRRAVANGFILTDKSIKTLTLIQVIQAIAIIILAITTIKR